MANLEEVPYFTPHIYQLERGQKADGGPQGLANLQPQQLAARTLWLKQRLEELQAQIDNAESSNNAFQVDLFDLSTSDIVNKYVTLEYAPRDPRKVELSVFGGVEQRAGTDFVVTGRTLSWSGLALELLLEQGISIAVRYAPAPS